MFSIWEGTVATRQADVLLIFYCFGKTFLFSVLFVELVNYDCDVRVACIYLRVWLLINFNKIIYLSDEISDKNAII